MRFTPCKRVHLGCSRESRCDRNDDETSEDKSNEFWCNMFGMLEDDEKNNPLKKSMNSC